MFLARKINKIPEFYMIFAPKMAEFCITARKYFPRFFGRGQRQRAPYPQTTRLLHVAYVATSRSWWPGI